MMSLETGNLLMHLFAVFTWASVCIFTYLFITYTISISYIYLGVELGPGDSNVGEKLCWSTKLLTNGGQAQSFGVIFL